MSERYMIATAFGGKIVDCTGCKNWSSKSLILLSMWLAAKADGVQSVAELYRLYGVNEPYSENQKIAEEVATWSDELIVVDLDERNIYFDTASRSPYSVALYRGCNTVDMAAVRMLMEVDNAYGWDDYYGYGSACCSGKRMPFDCFNHELLVKYCEEYYGWTMSAHSAEDDKSAEDDYGIKKEVLEWYYGLGVPMDVLKEYGEKWLADWLLLIEEEKQSTVDKTTELCGDEEWWDNYMIWGFALYVDEKVRQLHKPSWLISWENIRNEMAKATEEDK